MSRVRSRDTRPEMTVRHALHQLGYRYRLHERKLPGCPDLVFAARHKVIMVHGCFWHGHSCKYGRAVSKTNVSFWTSKIERNRERDRRVGKELKKLGWQVHLVWECAVKKDQWLEDVLAFLERH